MASRFDFVPARRNAIERLSPAQSFCRKRTCGPSRLFKTDVRLAVAIEIRDCEGAAVVGKIEAAYAGDIDVLPALRARSTLGSRPFQL